MSIIKGNRKQPQNSADPLYGEPEGIQMNDEKEIEYERFIVNLDKELINAIEAYIVDQKIAGVELFDIKTRKNKRINKSLWVRDVLYNALSNQKSERVIVEEKQQQVIRELQNRVMELEAKLKESGVESSSPINDVEKEIADHLEEIKNISENQKVY